MVGTSPSHFIVPTLNDSYLFTVHDNERRGDSSACESGHLTGTERERGGGGRGVGSV